VSATLLTGCQQIRTEGVSTDAGLTYQEQTIEQSHARRAMARSRARERQIQTGDGTNSEFEIFWRTYPHRGEYPDPKKPARLKFEAAVKQGADPAAIIVGAERYRAAVEANGTDARYVAQAQTWLIQERWKDCHEAPEPPRLRVGMN
jgi:hypothetical protein